MVMRSLGCDEGRALPAQAGLPREALCRGCGLCSSSGWVGLHVCSEERCLEDLVAALQ